MAYIKIYAIPAIGTGMCIGFAVAFCANPSLAGAVLTLGTAFPLMIYLGFLGYRNSLVGEVRIRAINDGTYKHLPGYDEMLADLFRFDWSDCPPDQEKAGS